jgi:hypothetical protein
MSAVSLERRRFKAAYPEVWKAGVLAACGVVPDRPGGYPLGFHNWPLDKRNAYFAAFNWSWTMLHGSPPKDDGEAAHG